MNLNFTLITTIFAFKRKKTIAFVDMFDQLIWWFHCPSGSGLVPATCLWGLLNLCRGFRLRTVSWWLTNCTCGWFYFPEWRRWSRDCYGYLNWWGPVCTGICWVWPGACSCPAVHNKWINKIECLYCSKDKITYLMLHWNITMLMG